MNEGPWKRRVNRIVHTTKERGDDSRERDGIGESDESDDRESRNWRK